MVCPQSHPSHLVDRQVVLELPLFFLLCDLVPTFYLLRALFSLFVKIKSKPEYLVNVLWRTSKLSEGASVTWHPVLVPFSSCSVPSCLASNSNYSEQYVACKELRTRDSEASASYIILNKSPSLPFPEGTFLSWTVWSFGVLALASDGKLKIFTPFRKAGKRKPVTRHLVLLKISV